MCTVSATSAASGKPHPPDRRPRLRPPPNRSPVREPRRVSRSQHPSPSQLGLDVPRRSSHRPQSTSLNRNGSRCRARRAPHCPRNRGLFRKCPRVTQRRNKSIRGRDKVNRGVVLWTFQSLARHMICPPSLTAISCDGARESLRVRASFLGGRTALLPRFADTLGQGFPANKSDKRRTRASTGARTSPCLVTALPIGEHLCQIGTLACNQLQ